MCAYVVVCVLQHMNEWLLNSVTNLSCQTAVWINLIDHIMRVVIKELTVGTGGVVYTYNGCYVVVAHAISIPRVNVLCGICSLSHNAA